MRLNLVAAGLGLAALASAHAAVLPTDGQWVSFNVSQDLSPTGSLEWLDDGYAPVSFDFTVASGYIATLTVVDAGYSGDRFQVLDGASVLGITGPAVNNVPDAPGLVDFNAALANPDFSRGVYTLTAGSHTISGLLSDSAQHPIYGALNSTIGGLRVTVSAVPEPASLTALIAGLGLIGLIAPAVRRRTV